MNLRFSSLLVLTLIVAILAASTTFSAKEPVPVLQYNPVIRAIIDYALPWDAPVPGATVSKSDFPSASLGSEIASTSPGVQIGFTYYDYQHNNIIFM